MLSILAITLNARGPVFANIRENKVLANISESTVTTGGLENFKLDLIQVMSQIKLFFYIFSSPEPKAHR